MRYIGFIFFFAFGILVGKLTFEPEDNNREEIQVFTNGIKKMSKLVVTQGSFAQVYNFLDSKKYFYDYMSFDKKAVISTNAKIEIGYDLSKLSIDIDSVGKKIIINSIPKEEVVIIPNIKYVTLYDSNFNEFTEEEHNLLRQKVVEKIKTSIEFTNLKQGAKLRLIDELSSLYQLSKIYNWKVVNNSCDLDLIGKLKLLKNDDKFRDK